MTKAIVGTINDDLFIATDRVIESFDGQSGYDTVDFSNWSIGVDVSLGSKSGTRHIVNVENLIGTAYNDVLQGDSNRNVLNGGKGDDLLIGSNGDWLIGGEGRDVARLNRDTAHDLHSGRDATGEYTVVWSDAGDFWLLNGVEYVQVGTRAYAVGADGTIDFSKEIAQPMPNDGNPEKIYGTDGDDTVNDRPGYQQYFGGAGTDTLVMPGNASHYHIGLSQDQIGLVVKPDTVNDYDILYDVEQVRFDDQTAVLNKDGTYTLHSNTPEPQPQPTTDVQFGGDNNDVFTNTAATRHVLGGAGIDTLLIDGNRGEYGIGQTLDGSGFVVWQGDNFTVLNSVEHLVFRDTSVALNGDGSIVESLVDSAPQNLVFGSNDADDFHQAAGTQYYVGNAGNDRLIINGNSADYGIGATLDQTGIVVWSGDAFDIAFDVEEVVFNDKTVFAANYIDGTFLN